jgi:hypothetical protein
LGGLGGGEEEEEGEGNSAKHQGPVTGGR